MSKFEDYFNIEYKKLENRDKIDINTILETKNYLISGDFYGIQKFIFEGLVSKNAAKVLRAKSAYVQLYTSYIAKYICHKLQIDEKNIISANAGKFEIISPKFDEEIFKQIQENLNQYFIKNYFGLSGIGLCFVEFNKNDFEDSKRYKELREVISNKNEEIKFRKFDLQNSNPILSYDENITNQTLCPLCNIRKIDKNYCKVCSSFVELGKLLTTVKIDELIKSDKLNINIDDFSCDLVLDEKIKSYIAKDEKNSILDFEDLSKNSKGTNAIAVLKADVDNMGNFLKNSDVTNSFENFDMFSKTMDNFFSLYIPQKMKEKFSNTYTVFAGGDDLFLLGSWDTILELARYIEAEFKKFVKNKDLSISFGIALVKPSTPISYVSNITEELLLKAKSIDDKKDAISLFGETVKWQSYKDVFENLYPLLNSLEDDEDKTAFFYRLLEFCDMSKNVKQGDIKSTIWKSKLNYSFIRNMKSISNELLNSLNSNIQDFPEETKMVLCEYIYKRRK